MSKLRIRVLLAALALGAAIVSGPVAVSHASPEQDQTLYDVMYQQGIVLYPQAYSQARRACGVMWGSYGTPDEVVAAFAAANPDWTYDQVRVFVAAAIAIYCPPPAATSLA